MRTRYAAGASSVVTPRIGSSHSDLAVATALAVYEHRRPPGSPDGATLGGRSSGLIGAMNSDIWPLIDSGRLTTARYGDSF